MGATKLNGDAIAVMVPISVRDHTSYRRWAYSGDFPERGRISYLAGRLWVDVTMERAGHNQIKSEMGATLRFLARQGPLGRYFADRMLLTNLEAGLSTEPDGMFVSANALAAERAWLEVGDDSLEVMGTPYMVLEIVSKSSVEKDTKLLRQLYWKAGVPECWLVDSRVEAPAIVLLRRGRTRYTPVRPRDGWVKSAVFGKWFRLTSQDAGDGLSDYSLEVR